MSTWAKKLFCDEQRIRETVAIGVVVVASIGLGVVLLGLWFARQ